MSDAITRGIRIQTKVDFLEEDSCPEEGLYVFSYNITISNHSDVSVQLMTRHWVITDADGKKEEVEGPGVVGQQPVIRPGQSFSYASFCPLRTPVGTMHGSYEMVTSQNDAFDAVIAPFSLSVPGVLH